MTREEIDTLWQRALHDAVKEGEQFTRYHFAALVLEEAAKACEFNAHRWPDPRRIYAASECAAAIRAMKPKGVV